jgi:hypothetical protein
MILIVFILNTFIIFFLVLLLYLFSQLLMIIKILFSLSINWSIITFILIISLIKVYLVEITNEILYGILVLVSKRIYVIFVKSVLLLDQLETLFIFIILLISLFN